MGKDREGQVKLMGWGGVTRTMMVRICTKGEANRDVMHGMLRRIRLQRFKSIGVSSRSEKCRVII